MSIKKPNLSQDDIETINLANQDLVFHVERVQGIETLEPYQERILKAMVEHQRIAIAACHDLGKTFIIARGVLAICSSFPGSKIITTAPNMTLIEKLLWAEIRHGYHTSKTPLGGKMLQRSWQIEDDWFAIGVSPRDEAGESQGATSNFQGFHARKLVVIFDEATGVSPKKFMQAEGMMTSHDVLWVCIGNPTTRSSPFFQCFRDPMWHKIYLSCFDSPNVMANNILNLFDLKSEVDKCRSLNEKDLQNRITNYKVVQPMLLTLQWVVRMALKWGMDHPLFVSKALGQFPEEEDNVTMPLAVVESSQNRWVDDHKKERKPTLRSVGVDPARYGTDKTVISIFEDNIQTHRIVLVKSSITEIVGKIVFIMQGLSRIKKEIIVVDGTGLGAGVVDGLLEARTTKSLSPNVTIKEVQFGASCEDEEDKKYFSNVKAKMFKLLGDSLKDDLALMDEAIYLEELPTIIYRFTSKGQLFIESKDEYKQRTGMGSPDDADSLALANFGRHIKGVRGSVISFEKKTTTSTHASGLKSGSKW